eukprot:SAG22_NODE_321_length_12398_cov_3.218392_1_plen_164_part_10
MPAYSLLSYLIRGRVSINNVVYDMTDFVKPDNSVDNNTNMTVMKHPGGQDIPLQFAGKDATSYWNDIHGHVRLDIFEDLSMGEGLNTGLDWLPVVKGRTVGPPPEAAQLPGGLPVANKAAYDEVVDNSLFSQEIDPQGAALKALAGLDDVGKRVVGAIIGSLVG